MAKKCLTATAKKGVFVQNETHKDIFNSNLESGSNLPFSYFRLSLPYTPFLIKQGAAFVAESHQNNIKVLYTGLRRSKINTILYGDVYNQLTQSKSLLLFKLMPGANSYTVFLFDGYYPKSLTKVLNEITTI